jgi:hypothetical protein
MLHPSGSNIGTVSTLIRKLKRAKQLFNASEESYVKLTMGARKSDIERWTREASQAQADRDKDIHAMDYFAIKLGKGIVESLIHV